MQDIVIQAEGLSKRYQRQRASSYRTLRDSLAETLRHPWHLFARRGPGREWFWALREVSFEVRAGEVLGVIGRNGAGKTTLLKILSRITRPTAGRVWVRGRVGSLLEIGTGFHPELTGRENIYLSGVLLGMKRREVAARFDRIVEFSGVGPFLETPLKHFSAGMQTRLAFAVAAHLEPEILLVDEVLAVGDLEFQQRCLGKMSEVAQGGRTVLFVSHHMNQIRHLCSRCLWLDNGQLRADGATQAVVAAYETSVLNLTAPPAAPRGCEVVGWELADSRSPHTLDHAGPVIIRFSAWLTEPIARGTLRLQLTDALGRVIWHVDWRFTGLPAGPCIFSLKLAHLPLRPGPYGWRAAMFDGGRWSDTQSLTPPLVVALPPIAFALGEFHSVLDLPFELEACPVPAEAIPRDHSSCS
jgi:lipopolysaccharide transport system ATP-binding protein